ncbi:GntR family transcriptional regulator [Xylophilus rhododendri]|uniref:GntR family transcriptional regulator n=1 Tax=Xylophilus rhododendri TaxID=2697032 RepID=A0A857JA75_9BURK|nr:GntR family transcriptional regulator [Xylophilus rhododendri]QHI99645.1 GntR family transcriptional regulator [Xylophilus rhododendri]
MSGLPTFEPVPAVTRRDHVVLALRRSILAGQIPPGTQLVESGLASQFGVSRGLLREAIRELIESGLVVNRPYAGAFVTEMNEALIRDVYQVRRVLEREAYTRIWDRRDAAFRAEMQSRFDLMMEAVHRDDLPAEIRAEAHFHGLVYERCGNHMMPAIWQQMTQKIQLGFAVCQISHGPKVDFEENHARFLQLALGDDLEAMLAELDIHLRRGLDTIQRAAETEPEALSSAALLAS